MTGRVAHKSPDMAVDHPLIPARYGRAAPVRRWRGLGLRPKPLVRVFGLRRSGNHAIIDWLARNAPTRHAGFLNNCALRADPFQNCEGTLVWRDRSKTARRSRDLLSDLTDLDGDLTLILSYEDALPKPARLSQQITSGIRDRKFDHELLVYRSFLNWAASLSRKLAANPAFSALDRASVMIEALRKYNDLLARVLDDSNAETLPVLFDAWFDDPSYRAALAARLDWDLRDPGHGPVQPFGGGSSFGETGAGADLNVTDRWRAQADDEEFRMLLRLAAKSPQFLDRLAAVFPDDANRLADLARVANVFDLTKGETPWFS